MLYEQMHASCFVKVDLEGNILSNPTDYGVNRAGFVIHSAVHAPSTRSTASSIRTPAGMAVSAMKCGLLPLAQTSMRFVHIAYHDFEGIVLDPTSRRAGPTWASTKG